jgi:hypothetical protein
MFHLLRLVLDSIDKVPLVVGFVWALGSRHFAYPFNCRLLVFDSFDSTLLLKGVKTVRDSKRSVEKRVGFVTNIVAPPLAVAPAVAAAARAITRRLIGTSKY